jgi:GMP synthase-like glutamine amidotransferase
MKKRILVLDNSIDRAVLRPVEEWARYFGKVQFDAFQLPDNEPVPVLDRYTHVLLTGSEASFATSEPWFDVEADIVRDAFGRGLSILGSGFGHQMLAWALSGPDSIRRSRIPELGWVAIDIVKTDSLLASCPNPWHVYTSHTDEVVLPPDPWRVLASNGACSVQAMRYGDHPVWGIQPHPETNPEEAVFQMGAGIESYPKYAQQIRQLKIESPIRDDDVASQLTAAFLKSKPL